jgi:hypothetical protein
VTADRFVTDVLGASVCINVASVILVSRAYS